MENNTMYCKLYSAATILRKLCCINKSNHKPNKNRVKKAIHAIYKEARLKPPSKIEWCRSPLELFNLAQSFATQPKNKPINNNIATHGALCLEKINYYSIYQKIDRVKRALPFELASISNNRISDQLNIIRNKDSFLELSLKPKGKHPFKTDYRYPNFTGDLRHFTEDIIHYPAFDAEMAIIEETADWIFPCEKTCFVLMRPKIALNNKAEVYHPANSPTISYPDGFGYFVYGLHGSDSRKK